MDHRHCAPCSLVALTLAGLLAAACGPADAPNGTVRSVLDETGEEQIDVRLPESGYDLTHDDAGSCRVWHEESELELVDVVGEIPESPADIQQVYEPDECVPSTCEAVAVLVRGANGYADEVALLDPSGEYFNVYALPPSSELSLSTGYAFSSVEEAQEALSQGLLAFRDGATGNWARYTDYYAIGRCTLIGVAC